MSASYEKLWGLLIDMKCPECGKIVNEKMSECNNCGCPKKYFIKIKKSVECSECGAKISARQECCPECGYPIDINDDTQEERGNKTTKVMDINQSLAFFGETFDQQKEVEVIVSKVVGVTFENRQENIEKLIHDGILYVGAKIILQPESFNIYDDFAIQVLASNKVQVGYLAKEINREIYRQMRKGIQFDATVVSIGGDGDKYNYGITIKIKKREKEYAPKVNIRVEVLNSDNIFAVEVEGYKDNKQQFWSRVSLSLSYQETQELEKKGVNLDAPSWKTFELPLEGYFDVIYFYFEEHGEYQKIPYSLSTYKEDVKIGLRFVEKSKRYDSPTYAGGYEYMHPAVTLEEVPYGSINPKFEAKISYLNRR